MNIIFFQGTVRLFSVTALISASIFAATPSAVIARPCGSSILSKVGCAIDPTNPPRNGGMNPLRPIIQPAVEIVKPKPPSPPGTDINFNEIRTGNGPVVFLVNGFGGCAPCIARALHNKLKANGIAVYDFDWNDIYRRNQQNNFNLADAEFLQQMEAVISAVPQSRPIVLIGHSFGGDSALKVAQRTSRRIALLGVLDAVELGGIRTRRSVSNNVSFFYNRWTSNPSGMQIPGIPVGAGIPLNHGMNGEVSCSAGSCDQKPQSYGYRADGSPEIDNCESWEASCTGYNPIPVALGGSNGTKQRRITHGGSNAIYKDQLIQEELFRKIQPLTLQARSSVGTGPNNNPTSRANYISLCVKTQLEKISSPMIRVMEFGSGRLNMVCTCSADKVQQGMTMNQAFSYCNTPGLPAGLP